MRHPTIRFSRSAPLAVSALTLALFGATNAAAEPPQVQFVNGPVEVLRADGTRAPARKGDALNLGDRLLTGPGGVAQVRAIDQGVVAVRPGSEIEFKPQALGLGVVLNQGQVRAVSDLGGPTTGLLQVITPDSTIAVDTGDIETGLVSTPEGSTTFSQVRSGEVTLNPESAGARPMPAGQSFKTVADQVLAVDALPVALTPPTLLPPVTDAPAADKLVALPPQSAPILNPALPVGGLAGGKLPVDFVALGTPGVAPINVKSGMNAHVAVPLVRVEASTTTIAGASNAVNQALANTLVLSAGRVGIAEKTLTPTVEAALTPKAPPVVFQPTTVQINGQAVAGIAPPTKSAVISGGTQVNQLVLVAPTVTPIVTPTVTPTLTAPVVSITPVTTQLVNTSTLNLNTVVVPTSTNLTSGFTFGGIRR